MKRKYKIAIIGGFTAAVLAGGAAMLLTGVGAAALSPSPVADSVPAQLTPPPGQHVVMDLGVTTGSQVYTCTNGSWTLLEPAALLMGSGQTVFHTKGPQWISLRDGSSVTAADELASVPQPNAVPQELLRATANAGNGVLSTVDFVQRLATSGGVAPAGTCGAGGQQSVYYKAEYRFYAPDVVSSRG